MSSYISAQLRRRLLAADDHQCVYCRTKQANSGFPMVVDHIKPVAKNGPTAFDNLCFSCHRCNLYKGDTTHQIDPVSGDSVLLFHPRTDQWHEHFRWSDDGIHLLALTATGRVTLIALNMNNDEIVQARQNWVSVGWHP